MPPERPMAERCEAVLPGAMRLRCYAPAPEAVGCPECNWFFMHCPRPLHEEEAREAQARHREEVHGEAAAVVG